MKNACSLLLFLGLLSAGCSHPQPVGSPVTTPSTRDTTPLFSEVARSAGIDYTWEPMGKTPQNILQTIGRGCAFLDADGDGNLDILIVGKRIALYRGDGMGNFVDISHRWQLDTLSGVFLGCAVGDYDNDGYSDVYITGYRGGVLLHNEKNRFVDVTLQAGVMPQPWGTSALFCDIDGDGLLDLCIGNYVEFGPTTDPQLCPGGNVRTSCGPRYYKPHFLATYRNAGRRFVPVALAEGTSGKVLGIAMVRFPGETHPQLVLANDEMPGDLLRFENGKYRNRALPLGTAYDRQGHVYGGMGVDWGDADGDGQLDLFVGTFQNETKLLFQNQGDSGFVEIAEDTELSAMSAYVTFGCKFFDLKNSGNLDLIAANGHVQDNIEKIDQSSSYRQPVFLFENQGPGRFPLFKNISERLPESARRPIVGRGVATGDYDNDGQIDVLIADSEGAPLLLHNEVKAPGNWIGFRLEQGQVKGRTHDGYGAIVTVVTGSRKVVRLCHAGGSYLSSSDARIHIGLGTATRIDSVQVEWPDGKREKWQGPPAGKYYRWERGKAPQ
jgi:hypothetical protein